MSSASKGCIPYDPSEPRFATAATSPQPFNERLALFWSNHFTVSMAKASARGIVGAYEREAIRPHIGGSFEALLKSASTHGGMLRYLDNDSSAGPDSPLVRRRTRRPRGDGPPPHRRRGTPWRRRRGRVRARTAGRGSWARR